VVNKSTNISKMSNQLWTMMVRKSDLLTIIVQSWLLILLIFGWIVDHHCSKLVTHFANI
jgi:hypothetical protein